MKPNALTQNKQPQTNLSAKMVQAWLIAYLAKHLKTQPESIDPYEPFYGQLIGGFQSSGIVTDLENWLNIKLPSSFFYEHPDIATLSHHIVKAKLRSMESQSATHAFNLR